MYVLFSLFISVFLVLVLFQVKLAHLVKINYFTAISICIFTALASVLPPTAQPLTEQLRSIASATVAVVNLEYEGFVLPVTVRLYSVISNNNKEAI